MTNFNSGNLIRSADQLPDLHQESVSDSLSQPLPIPAGLPANTDISMFDNPQANLHWLLQLYRNQLINGENSVAQSCPVSTPLPSTLLPSTPPPSTPSRLSQVLPVEDFPGGSISGPTDISAQQASKDDDPFLSPTGSPNASGQKRVRVSSTNAVYDFVTGAMRGNKALCSHVFTFNHAYQLNFFIAIARTAPLRPTCDTVSQTTRRFNREIPQILSRVCTIFFK